MDSIYSKYDLGIVCRGEKEFINCQEKYMLLGYDWHNSKRIVTYASICQPDGSSFSFSDYKNYELILYLSSSKMVLGFDDYNSNIKKSIGNLKVVKFNDREKKLGRILGV